MSLTAIASTVLLTPPDDMLINLSDVSVFWKKSLDKTLNVTKNHQLLAWNTGSDF